MLGYWGQDSSLGQDPARFSHQGEGDVGFGQGRDSVAGVGDGCLGTTINKGVTVDYFLYQSDGLSYFSIYLFILHLSTDTSI